MNETVEEEASCHIVINLEDHYPIKNEEIAEWRTKLDEAARSLALEGSGDTRHGRGIVTPPPRRSQSMRHPQTFEPASRMHKRERVTLTYRHLRGAGAAFRRRMKANH
jgi:hypothetical protein